MGAQTIMQVQISFAELLILLGLQRAIPVPIALPFQEAPRVICKDCDYKYPYSKG